MGSNRTITPSHSGAVCNSSGLRRPQIKKLVAKLDRARVHQRVIESKTIDYLEGWFVVSEANAIFGFDGWDRETLHMEKLFEQTRFQETQCAYSARVRVRVKAGGSYIIREGSGFGEASASSRAGAHERALKAAETDATKRALATFGNRFGLCLYDKDQAGVTGSLAASTAASVGTSDPRKQRFILRGPGKEVISDDLSAEAFCAGLRQVIEKIQSVAALEELFAANRDTLLLLRQVRQDLRSTKGTHFVEILERLLLRRKEFLQGLTQPRYDEDRLPDTAGHLPTSVVSRSGNQEAVMVAEDPSGADPGIGNGLSINGASTPKAKTVALAICEQPAAAARLDVGQVAPATTGKNQGQYLNNRPEPSERDHRCSAAIAPQGSKEPSGSIALPRSDQPDPEMAGLLDDKGDGQRPESTMFSALAANNPDVRNGEIIPELKIDKSQLLIGTQRRVRSKAHLRYVSSKPCLICGELPSHAHHLRFAQTRGLSIKVSDEFAVPLCPLHHNLLHRSADERVFWHQHEIDPLKAAAELWAKT